MDNPVAPHDEMITCPWCQNVVQQDILCSVCKLRLNNSAVAPVEPVKPVRKPKREKPTRESSKDFRAVEGKETMMGIDPGAQYTGIVVRDNDIPLYSGIFVRPEGMEDVPWALECVRLCEQVHAEYKPTYVSIEKVVEPKGFHKGNQAPINPKHIIKTAIVLGALALHWPDAILIDPGGNGDLDNTFYPDVLNGSRPKTLAGSNKGANTRKHEKSAYDVAGKAMVKMKMIEELYP